MSEVIFLA